MITVNNLDGLGKLIFGDVSNPSGPISEYRGA
jgi:hypothetical protein